MFKKVVSCLLMASASWAGCLLHIKGNLKDYLGHPKQVCDYVTHAPINERETSVHGTADILSATYIFSLHI